MRSQCGECFFLLCSLYLWGSSGLCSCVPSFLTLYFLTLVPLGPVIRKCSLSFHCFADYTQLYLPLKCHSPWPLQTIFDCSQDIKDWMSQNFWMLKKLNCGGELTLLRRNSSHCHPVWNPVQKLLGWFGMNLSKRFWKVNPWFYYLYSPWRL